MMHILSIGNSFSEDAQRYLHAFSVAEGNEIHCVNLFIGGCSLAAHWENARLDHPLYHYQENGEPQQINGEPRLVTIYQALTERKWDVVTIQQASHDSGDYATYQPYLGHLAAYIRRWAPQARLMIQQTWAYEIDSHHPAFPRYQSNQETMYDALTAAYTRASQAVRAPLIPSGAVIQALRREPPFDYANGGLSLCRDGFHMSEDFGRYALAATWYSALTGLPAHAPILPLDQTEAPALSLLSLICQTAAAILHL